MPRLLNQIPRPDKINNLTSGDSLPGTTAQHRRILLSVRDNQDTDNVTGKLDYNLLDQATSLPDPSPGIAFAWIVRMPAWNIPRLRRIITTTKLSSLPLPGAGVPRPTLTNELRGGLNYAPAFSIDERNAAVLYYRRNLFHDRRWPRPIPPAGPRHAHAEFQDNAYLGERPAHD